MMFRKIKLFFCAAVALACAFARAGGKTFEHRSNPLIRDKFTADPAPLVFGGKLYLYVGHDEYYEGQDEPLVAGSLT